MANNIPIVPSTRILIVPNEASAQYTSLFSYLYKVRNKYDAIYYNYNGHLLQFSSAYSNVYAFKGFWPINYTQSHVTVQGCEVIVRESGVTITPIDTKNLLIAESWPTSGTYNVKLVNGKIQFTS